jgi:hypothetical protein
VKDLESLVRELAEAWEYERESYPPAGEVHQTLKTCQEELLALLDRVEIPGQLCILCGADTHA